MRAAVGDRLVITGHRLGEPERGGEIVGVKGVHGAPPYLVRWDVNGHVSDVFPGQTPGSSADRGQQTL